VNEIENKTWYSGEQIREKLKELLKRVWRREGFPEKKRKRIITSIH